MTREEAIKTLREWRGRMADHGVPDFGEKYKALGMAIEALQDGWIPVGERLPMVGEDVLFCDSRWVEEGCLRADGDWWMFRWSSTVPKEKIIAWRPLPEPYKESDNK